MANILLAEDDQAMRHFLKGSLEKAGHNVTACPDGLIALETLKAQGSFDLLLSDIVMPGLDGMELSRRAKALYPSIKTLFITGFSAMAVESSTGDAQVIAKPFHLARLIEQINELLSSS